MSYNTIRFAAGALTAGLLAVPSGTALAQDADTSPRYQAGLGIGIGELSADCQGCDGALESVSGAIQLARRLTSSVAMVVEASAVAHSGDDVTLSQTLLTIGPRLSVTPKFWIAGAGGAGYLSLETATAAAESDVVPALAVSAGYEVYRKNDFGLELQLRSGVGFYSDDTDVYNASLNLATTFDFGHRPRPRQDVAQRPARPAPRITQMVPRQIQPASAPAPVVESAEPTPILVATARFRLGSARIGREAYRALLEVADQLAGADSTIEIVGHTDATGELETNALLSAQRAQAIADFLAAHGVSRDRMRTVGKGDTQPRDPEDTPEAHAQNRRAEILETISP